MQRVVPGIGDERDHDPGRLLSDVGCHDGSRGLEPRVRPLHLEVLVQDAQEAPEVGVAPFATGPLALLDDRVDRTLRGVEIGHRDELRPPEVHLGRLGVRRPDEQALGAEPSGHVFQAGWIDR